MTSSVVPPVEIKNFVCSVNLGMRFDLTDLLMKSQKRAELVPKKNCILMKIPSPDTTAMLFSNGKLVVTGANSEEEVKTAARKFTQIIQKMDYPGVNLIDFKIRNVIGNCDVGFRILMEKFASAHASRCIYEPELYPAVIYRLAHPSVKILVFVSGKLVSSLIQDPRDLHAACEQIYPLLVQFEDKKQVDQRENLDAKVDANMDAKDEDD
ncbi:unnamed protein product [Albugo candida]|uniref:TATA-box-binding protein n=2 Tax=Albugo candida TaxID=65357 RepID=A0A024G8S3_9STRA|nr:unnamed protein product [Albugo candida]|eukprot:CCI43271.1 unnamed protein product [Albugo candida]